MGLPSYARTAPFWLGFAAVVLTFLAANVRSYWVNPCFFMEGQCGFGFPFEAGYGFPFSPWLRNLPFDSEVIWGGLVANCFIAVTAGILLGRLCNRMFRHRTAFK